MGFIYNARSRKWLHLAATAGHGNARGQLLKALWCAAIVAHGSTAAAGRINMGSTMGNCTLAHNQRCSQNAGRKRRGCQGHSGAVQPRSQHSRHTRTRKQAMRKQSPREERACARPGAEQRVCSCDMRRGILQWCWPRVVPSAAQQARVAARRCALHAQQGPLSAGCTPLATAPPGQGESIKAHPPSGHSSLAALVS